jgi:hypothetical protein
MDSQEYRIALDPSLNLSPAEFVAAWNADPTLRAQGEARLQTSTGTQFDFGAGLLVVLSGIAINMTSSVLYDFVKRAVRARQAQAPVAVQPVGTDQRDGSLLLAVTTDTAPGDQGPPSGLA